jgi:pimeloyl-ACP methyl ester carboxylesterase
MTPRNDGLHLIRQRQVGSDRRQMVVFVHGIFSSHKTFDRMVEWFKTDSQLSEWDLYYYDYDYGRPILQSAARLRRYLNESHGDADVTLIGHSMGGLVSRFALVDGHPLKRFQLKTPSITCVKRIVMLGTPNFGAMTSGQLSILWQLATAGAKKIAPFIPKSPGVLDLTAIQSLYRQVAKYTDNAPPCRAECVEYITVPGLFFNDERKDTDFGPDGKAATFVAMNILCRLLSTRAMWEARIPKPHDGIVAASSVNMTPADDRESEKSVAIATAKAGSVSYGHIVPRTMADCTHVTIQEDRLVFESLRDILRNGSLEAWKKGLSKDNGLYAFSNLFVPGT